jgi:hypothetical protein
MLKSLMAGAAALALMAGAALAQDQDTTTMHERTTVESHDGDQTVKSQKSEHSTDAYGNDRTDAQSTEHHADANGNETHSKKTYHKTDNADGSKSEIAHEEHKVTTDRDAPAYHDDATHSETTTTTRTRTDN